MLFTGHIAGQFGRADRDHSVTHQAHCQMIRMGCAAKADRKVDPLRS
jgi:hypothetical protein